MKTSFLLPQPFQSSPLLLANTRVEETLRQPMISAEPIKVIESRLANEKELDQPQNWDEAWFTNYE